MQEARSAGSALVHFPEAAASGCSRALINGWDRFDWGLLVEELQTTAALARELGL
jgi:hypothetical protein